MRRIGPHPNIIALRGESPDGILLERVKNGTVANFMQKMGKTQIAQHSRWIHDATKAIVASHKVIVIRCDISASNLLLNEDLNAKLCDFHGIMLSPEGQIVSDRLARENIKSTCQG